MSEKITITINDKTHHFDANDKAAMAQMDWQDRKQLIALLENIRQAEHITPTESEQTPATKQIKTPQPDIQPSRHQVQDASHQTIREGRQGEGDVDALMSRLIMQEQQNRTSIPDRGTVLKWMLVFFAVVVLLMLI